MNSAHQTLQKLVADVLNRLPAARVPLEAWQFACGKQVAERTTAVSFDDGVLRVEVPDVSWQAQLQSLSGCYLSRLNQYSGTRIERVEFAVASSEHAAEDARRPGTGVAKRRPSSEVERESRWRRQK